MNLTRYEQETIVNFNEEEKEANIFTHNGPMRRRLEKLSQERPQDCRLVRRDGQAVEYYIPKNWISIRPPRIASEAQKEAARAALQKAKNRG